MNEFIHTVWADESGQDMAEYGLLLALIAIVVVVALTPLGTNIRDRFQEVADELAG